MILGDNSSDGLIEEWNDIVFGAASVAFVALEPQRAVGEPNVWFGGKRGERGPRPLAGRQDQATLNPRFDGDSSPGRHEELYYSSSETLAGFVRTDPAAFLHTSETKSFHVEKNVGLVQFMGTHLHASRVDLVSACGFAFLINICRLYGNRTSSHMRAFQYKLTSSVMQVNCQRYVAKTLSYNLQMVRFF